VELDRLASSPEVVALVPQVVATHPHDPSAYTQGLEEHEGLLLESTGRYGRSDRRWVEPTTGKVLAWVPLPPEQFGEGLTVAGSRVFQLTWREGQAHVADVETLQEERTIAYRGQGWGLCHDGDRLVMSDGSDTLRFRDPATFAETGTIEVTRDGAPVVDLNELECSDGLVWANVFQTSAIVAIEPDSGRVVAVVDASSLVPAGLEPGAVLNGIARRPGTDTFWLTGKLWPVLYEVRLVHAAP
jgi:glutamine cyclotransferase